MEQAVLDSMIKPFILLKILPHVRSCPQAPGGQPKQALSFLLFITVNLPALYSTECQIVSSNVWWAGRTGCAVFVTTASHAPTYARIAALTDRVF